MKKKKESLIGGGRKRYSFLSFYLSVKSTELKEMVSLPAVCCESTVVPLGAALSLGSASL